MCFLLVLCVQSKFCVFLVGFACFKRVLCGFYLLSCVFVGSVANNKQLLLGACYVQCVPCLLISVYAVCV